MLECWNVGIMGFGELTEWVIVKTKLTKIREMRNSDLIRSVEEGFPLFHYSMHEAKLPTLSNTYNFNML